MDLLSDEYYMKKALEQAEIAFELKEVPVGAVVVHNNKIIAKGHNLCEKLIDFTAHAEMQVLTAASNYLQSKYLNECKLYVTLEPCVMCAGAAFWTRIGYIIYGAKDLKRGYSTKSNGILHPKTIVKGPVLENDCSAILKSFFKDKR
tara:strand:- start:29 stop:469 length:441 start_codon:yes stop_codon:yes gene_type:complete